MKLRLTALILCTFMFCMLLSSCTLVLLTPDSLPVSSAISENEETENSSENVEVSSETESSEATSNDEASRPISSQSQSSVNESNSSKSNSSKAQNSSSKQNSSQKKPDISSSSSKPEFSSEKENITDTSLEKPTQNTVAMPIRPIRPDEYYGWQYLNKYASETTRRAYQLFVESFGNYEKKIIFDFNIKGEEAELAFDCYKNDYPQHFWVRDASYRSKKDYVYEFILIKIPFNGKMDKVKELEKQMLEKSTEILAKVNGSMSALERERIIHDSLIKNTIYDTTLKDENAHNLCGPIVEGTAVCEGYSKAFQYLLYQLVFAFPKFHQQITCLIFLLKKLQALINLKTEKKRIYQAKYLPQKLRKKEIL